MAEEKERKRENLQYKERFQFLLTVKDKRFENENIICQRYFKMNGFNAASLASVELKDTLDEAVELIQEDLVEKSRRYMDIVMPSRTIKATGFVDGEKETYCTVKTATQAERINDPILKPYDITFKFVLLVDDKTVYEKIWDGTVYPRVVRNSVDLSNSDSSYRGRDENDSSGSVALMKKLTQGRGDLVYKIIRLICGVCDYHFVEEYGDYHTTVEYGDKTYSLNAVNENLEEWRRYTKKKDEEYFGKYVR